MNPTSLRPDNLEKLMGLQWCFMLLSSLLFIDCYLIVLHDINIMSINFDWFKENGSLREGIVFLSTFSIVFSIIIPGASLVISMLLDDLYKKISLKNITVRERLNADLLSVEPENYIEPEFLKSWAIRNSNYPAYQEYRYHHLLQKQQAFFETLCRSILIMFLLQVYILEDKNPIFEVIKGCIFELDWILKLPTFLTFLFILIYFLLVAFSIHSPFNKFVKVKNHGIDDLA